MQDKFLPIGSVVLLKGEGKKVMIIGYYGLDQTGKTVEIRSENSGIANAHPVEMIREVVELEMSRIKNS